MIGVYSHLLGKVFRFHYHSQKTIASLGYRNVLGEFLIFETGWYIFNSIVPSEEITYPTFGRGQSSSKVPWEWIYIYIYVYVSYHREYFHYTKFLQSENWSWRNRLLSSLFFGGDESGDVSTQVMQNILRREGGLWEPYSFLENVREP